MSWLGGIILILVVGGVGYGLYVLFPPRKKDTKLLYIEALENLLKGNREDAFWKLKELVKCNTNHINAYVKLGDILRETGKPEQAARIHQSLMARPTMTPEQKVDVYTGLAKDFYAVKQYARAEENATEVLRLDKKNYWASLFLVEMAEHQRQWSRASERLRRVERLTGREEPQRHAYYRLMEGKASEKEGKVHDAQDSYLRAIKTDKSYAEPYLYLANLYEREGYLGKAVENWMRFAELSPKEGKQVFSKLEKALFDLGRFGEIEGFYSRIIDRDAENVDAISGYVNVLLAKGEIDHAMSLIEDVLAKNNKSVRAHLARLKLSLRKINQDQLSADVDRIVDLIHGGNGFQSVAS